MTPANIIRGALKRYGVSQKEMARVMQITQPALSLKLKRNRMTLDDIRIIDKRAPFTDEECRMLVKGGR